MKIDFTSLQTETVQYFVLNSGVFVAGLGLLFFLLGLTFGGLTWRRYRHRWLGVVSDEKKLREEVADLQKQLSEREPPKAPEPPLSKEARKSPAPSPEPEKPALMEMPDLMQPKVAAPLAAAAIASEALPKFELPSIPDLPVFSQVKPTISEAVVTPPPLNAEAVAMTPEPPAKSESSEETPDDQPEAEPEIHPFSFLLSDDPEEPAAEPPAEDTLTENEADNDEAEPFGFIIEEDEEDEEDEESPKSEPQEKSEASDSKNGTP